MMMRGVLVFSAGGLRLGVAIADVSRLVVEGDIAPVPFGHPGLAGIMKVDDVDVAIVPVFDLNCLAPEAQRPPRQKPGATVAVIPTARGPVGLRLDRLLGTASDYDAADTEPTAIPDALRRTLAGAGRPRTASVAVGAEVFFFFSPEAFIAAVGL